ncbi:precorrin-6A synthase (deacetylating) [Dietzia sp.]|uniref:precorrin-6A synthase (deacetylating) n=1 Tax=Dietzia sp. TaxID=1871616 RepID=UPI002FDA2914
MRSIVAIGIGTGNPEHLTGEATAAMRSLDVVLVLDKGTETADMRDLRARMLATQCAGREPRTVLVEDTKRDPELAARDYEAAVEEWHGRRVAALSAVIREELPEGGTAGFLVWGDPSLYDSTLRMLERLRGVGAGDSPESGGGEFAVRSIAGITAPSALCAAFAIPANAIGQAIHITTGRNLPETDPGLLRNCFVMLDGGCAFRKVAEPDTEIYWGAYLGDPRQILIHGTVGEVGEEIAAARAAARAENGWIMDTYLLRAAQPASQT